MNWFTDPANWSGAGAIPTRMVEHLLISLVVVLIAAALALPLGVWIGHQRRGGGVVTALAGAARAVPTLGLLTLLGLALGIGLLAPGIALVVLAIPPLLAGAYAGVAAVDGQTVKAARAMGMKESQLIFQVELPLAAPVVIGGVRSAVIQVIATATLAAYTADAGLGRFIFAGLKTRDYGEMIGGALLVIALALLVEALFSLAHLIPGSGNRRTRTLERTRS
nr:ABC transporter permease subunit [Corynebacterium occultum]